MKKNIPSWVQALIKLSTQKEISDYTKEISEKGISKTSLNMKISPKSTDSFSTEQLELLEKVAERVCKEKQQLINEVLNEKQLFSFSELQKYSGFIEFLFRARLAIHVKEKLSELTKEKQAPQIIINLATEKYIQLKKNQPTLNENEKQFVRYKNVYYFNFVKIMQYQTAIVTAQGTVLNQDYHEEYNIL